MMREFFSVASSTTPLDLILLTTIFESSRSFKTEDFWGWNMWEIVLDGEAHSIDVLGKLDRLYCLMALRTLAPLSHDRIARIVLPPSRNLADLSKELGVKLDSIETNRDQWDFILDEAARTKVGDLRTLLENARQAQELNEAEYLKTAPIDPVKLKLFRGIVKQSFDRSGSLRPVLIACSAYRDLTAVPPAKAISAWGYTQINDKAAFIKSWHVHYTGIGENYGRGLANSEDQLIFERTINGAGGNKDVEMQNLVSEIEGVFSKYKYEAPIILCNIELVNDLLERSSAFISRYRSDCPKTKLDVTPGYVGIMKLADHQIPVVQIFVEKVELRNKVVVADLANFGILIQYSPTDKPEDEPHLSDILLIRVTDLNADRERRQEIINAKPEWLNQYDDKEGYLRQKVVITVRERIEFKVRRSEGAYCLAINDHGDEREDR